MLTSSTNIKIKFGGGHPDSLWVYLAGNIESLWSADTIELLTITFFLSQRSQKSPEVVVNL